MKFSESIKNGVCAISIASLGMTACLGVTGCSFDNVENNDNVENTDNVLINYMNGDEAFFRNFEYTCVWFDRENSAVLIPAYSYRSYRTGLMALNLFIPDANYVDIVINGDYILFKTNDDITSYDMALAFAESVLGEDGKITNYADYIQEAKEKQKVKTLN